MLKQIFYHSKIVLFHALLGIAFLFSYQNLTTPHFEDYSFRGRDIRGVKTFELPGQQSYLLKIWGETIPDFVYFNSVKIAHSIFTQRKIQKEFFYNIPPKITKDGENTLKIVPPHRYSFKLKNAITSASFGVVLFKSSLVKKQNIKKFAIPWILFFILLGETIAYSIQRFLGISFNKYFIRYCLTYAFCLLFLFFLLKLSALLPFRLYFFPIPFIGICLLIILIPQTLFMFNSFIRETTTSPDAQAHMPKDAKSIHAILKKIYFKKMADPVKKWAAQQFFFRTSLWLLEQKFSDKCAAGFVFLLFLCVFFLSFRVDVLAEVFAITGYLALLVGITIKLGLFMKRERQGR